MQSAHLILTGEMIGRWLSPEERMKNIESSQIRKTTCMAESLHLLTNAVAVSGGRFYNVEYERITLLQKNAIAHQVRARVTRI